MKLNIFILCVCCLFPLKAEDVIPVKKDTIPNPAIDYAAFKDLVIKLEPVREKNRVTEAKFIEMMADKNTVILDARNEIRYQGVHVKGAKNLPFSEFTVANLAKIVPQKDTRILIYCNNNFDNEPIELARKLAPVSLNVPTFINLHAYGYTNVFELGPLLDINTTKIPIVRNQVREGFPSKVIHVK